MVEENYFVELSKIKGSVEKKNGLSYISWADAWDKLKIEFPLANFKVYQSESGMPYFADGSGGFVKVGVSVKELEHIVFLPVLDNRNQSVKKENLNVFAINKSIQRALAKAIAMHGMGLYVFRGEDLPTDITCDSDEEQIAKQTGQTESGVPTGEGNSTKKVDLYRCSKCNVVINKKVSEYSILNYEKPLCFNHQKQMKLKKDLENDAKEALNEEAN